MEVVVEKEDELHPSLPLLCLLASKESKVVDGFNGVQCVGEEDNEHKGKQITATCNIKRQVKVKEKKKNLYNLCAIQNDLNIYFISKNSKRISSL